MEARAVSRRQFLVLSASIGGLALLNACAPKAEPTKPPVKAEPTKAPEKAAEPVEVQIMWRTNAQENPFVEDLIVAFEDKYPNIMVEQIVVPWDEFEPKVMSMYAAGDAPDILGMGGTNPYIERFLRGMILELDPYLEKYPEMVDGLWPVAIKAYTKQGKIAGIPYAVLATGVFINATRFDEAGVDYPPYDWSDESWTWDAMIETAKKLTLDKNSDGKIDQYGLSPSHSTPWYYTRLWGQDIISEEDYEAGIVHQLQTDDPAVYEACVAGLQARADAIHKHKVAPTPSSLTALQEMGSPLKTGSVAMDFTGFWAVEGALPEEFGFRCAAGPLGGAGGSGTRGHHCWANPLQIVESSKHPDEAFTFVHYFIADADALPVKHKHNQRVPSMKSFFDDYVVEYAKNLAMTADEIKTFYSGAIEQATTSAPCHVLAGWAVARDIMRAELDALWLGERSAKETVDAMIPKMNAKYKEVCDQLGL